MRRDGTDAKISDAYWPRSANRPSNRRWGLDVALASLFAALRKEVRAAAISKDGKHTAIWCIEQLPRLYIQFRQTSETRYSEEISRLLQAVLDGLVASKPVCPKAQVHAASISNRLRLLHDEFGIPALKLRSPVASLPRSRKGGIVAEKLQGTL
jgi:hypothetical protein